MKRHAFFFLVFLYAVAGFSQNCEPDLNTTDKITKQGRIGWDASLFESGIGNSFINTSDWYINLQFGRFGNSNALTIYIDKYEESAQNAAFESQYQGEKGKDIYLAFTQGDPLKLTVQSAKTSSKMNNVLGKLVTTIALRVFLSPDNIQAIKKALEGGTLTTVRINLANGMRIEKDVKEKKAKKVYEKFQCFLDYNAKNPVTEPTAQPISTDIPENLPRDANNKVTFEEAVVVDSATKDKLFARAKSWMVNYYKNDQFAVNNPSEGQLIRGGSFIKTYTKPNGKTESETHIYNITIWVKDGKYKYNISDIVLGKTPLETGYEELAKSKNTNYKRYVDQQVYTGIMEVIANLKTAMASDGNTKSDW